MPAGPYLADVYMTDYVECDMCGGYGSLIETRICLTCESPPEIEVLCDKCGGRGEVDEGAWILSYGKKIYDDEWEEIPLWVYDQDPSLEAVR